MSVVSRGTLPLVYASNMQKLHYGCSWQVERISHFHPVIEVLTGEKLISVSSSPLTLPRRRISGVSHRRKRSPTISKGLPGHSSDYSVSGQRSSPRREQTTINFPDTLAVSPPMCRQLYLIHGCYIYPSQFTNPTAALHWILEGGKLTQGPNTINKFSVCIVVHIVPIFNASALLTGSVNFAS